VKLLLLIVGVSNGPDFLGWPGSSGWLVSKVMHAGGTRMGVR